MASGFSERFGSLNKLLADFRGKPLARYTLELAAAINFSGGIFLTASSREVAALASDLGVVRVLENTAPEKGLRESVRLGVAAAGTESEYYIFFPCDQPFLDAASVHLILGARAPGRIVEPRCNGRPGNPCLFSAAFREELLSLNEGETPRLLKTRHPQALRGVEITNPLALEDIDDEETLARLSNA
jgi:CTP:molybdopterin cytidylyltransferase MocA